MAHVSPKKPVSLISFRFFLPGPDCMPTFSTWRGRDRLSRRRRGRADRAGARLRLQQGGELGAVRAGPRRSPRAGRRVIALDNRGHGESSKLYEPADYHTALMAEDVRALLDHLRDRARRRDGLFPWARGLPPSLALAHPQRVRSLILGGLGIKLGRRRGPAGLHRRGAGSAEHRRCERSGRPHVPRLRRADQIRTAGARGLHPRLAAGPEPEQVGGTIQAPAPGRGGQQGPGRRAPAAELADMLFPNGQALEIPDRDHMLAVGDKVFKAARA